MDIVRVSIKLLTEALDLSGIENYVYGTIVVVDMHYVIQANEHGRFMKIYPYSCTIEDSDLEYVSLKELVRDLREEKSVVD